MRHHGYGYVATEFGVMGVRALRGVCNQRAYEMKVWTVGNVLVACDPHVAKKTPNLCLPVPYLACCGLGRHAAVWVGTQSCVSFGRLRGSINGKERLAVA